MNIAISVHGAPGSTQACLTALRFARAAIAAGHRVYRVFFFHDGVLAANQLMVTPQDERTCTAGWVELANAHGIELAVCVTAALRRGVVGDAERDRYDLAAANLDPAFTLVGLGQLIEALEMCERSVTFSA